jgi:hypothetical protein
VVSAISLLSRIRSSLLVALTLYLSRPIRHGGSSESADLQSLAAVLLPGDVLLTDGNTRAAALVRRMTRSTWAHVAMYVGPLEEGTDPHCIVEADLVTGVRSVRLSKLRDLHVRVLRPTPLNDTDRRRLADWVVSRIGDKYDLAHAWALGTRLLRLPLAARLPPPPSKDAQISSYICSSLLAHAFLLVGYPIAPIRARLSNAATPDLKNVTPCDFENASIFQVVTPP